MAGSNTGYSAGEYVSLGVTTGSSSTTDVVSIVWYDSENRHLYYRYLTSPLTLHNGDTTASAWSEPVQVFTGDLENAGEYCQMIVDKSGGIHIAAYDPMNLDLVYAYASSYSGTFTTCVVDSNGVVGSNLSLDVAKNASGYWTPYIGYYATSCVKPKMAYKVSSTNSAIGSSDDAFTGNWECSVIPTSYTASLGSQGNNRMNIGVWKTSTTDWTIANSMTGDEIHNHSGTSYGATCNDTVWGNGTSNPIMGYAIKVSSSTGYIETAQMK